MEKHTLIKPLINSLQELAKTMGEEEYDTSKIPEMKQDGNSIFMEVEGENIKEFTEIDPEASKEEIKKDLEDEGYTVK